MSPREIKTFLRSFGIEYFICPIISSIYFTTAHSEISYRKFDFDVLEAIQNATYEEIELLTKHI